jgi:uncharacterized protein
MKPLFPNSFVFSLTLAVALAPISATSQTGDALAQCLTLAGTPDAGVPVTPEAQEAILAAARAAMPFCAEAVAAGSQDAGALFHLGVGLQLAGEHTAAIAQFEAASAAGLGAADTKLGDYSLFGIGPVRTDPDAAVEHYRRGIERGDLAAMTTLGFLYRLGRGVPRDSGEMIRLMTEAAEGGYHFAQLRLGQTYLTGDGIPGGADADLNIPDTETAARYFSMAAEQGSIVAVLELAKIYSETDGPGTGDPALQLRWTQRAADAGLAEAVGALGFLYERGRGVDPDPEQAAALYVRALETGEVDLGDLRGEVGGFVPPWDRATAMAFQVILQERGLYRGAIDGIIGPMSRAGAAALDN